IPHSCAIFRTGNRRRSLRRGCKGAGTGRRCHCRLRRGRRRHQRGYGLQALRVWLFGVYRAPFVALFLSADSPDACLMVSAFPLLLLPAGSGGGGGGGRRRSLSASR
ncbi:unnamed protein product, partial [Phaeothamnion confervicola]